MATYRKNGKTLVSILSVNNMKESVTTGDNNTDQPGIKWISGEPLTCDLK